MITSMSAAIASFTTMTTAALPTARVIYGPGRTDEFKPLEVFIGVEDPDSEDFSRAVTDGEQSWVTTGKGRDERFIIHNVVAVINGDDDLVQARLDAFAAVELLGAAVVADPTLAGAVLYATIEVTGFDHAFTDLGAIVRVNVDIKCRSRL